MSDPDLEPGNIVIATAVLVVVIVVMVAIAVCLLATSKKDEDIELQPFACKESCSDGVNNGKGHGDN